MDPTKKSKVIIVSFVAGALLLGFLAYWGMASTGNEHMATIKKVIAEKGGVIVAHGVTAVPADESPFERGGKGNTIYKIDYTKDGKPYTAWYRSENHSSILKEPEEWILP
ncbi:MULTISPECIES: hypothetical protein [Brevibacillus]|uniref:hypothetical protein n=1 Tax=Brevibacillus TaxID=55080 RepID=UPI000F09E98F|nr:MULTISPECIES: hypothetical protein [Brevibacillus]MEC2133009.1 hypothetical protein [Brevibacillus centrosporus]MED1791612.1 hypothetical protein [Brevibacillus nitrificans]MED1949430.1 hypothetical protein [Brevibacillus centrosporus]MED4910826.1 hypothetical protein [Brevibacillus centrosporus]RNB73482.1 hypothetical protein EDM55_00375 [Brevibacillus centrosporus]